MLNINESESKLNQQRELDLSSLSLVIRSGQQTELKFDKVLSTVIQNSMKDIPKIRNHLRRTLWLITQRHHYVIVIFLLVHNRIWCCTVSLVLLNLVWS